MQPAFASIVLCLAATAIAGGAVPQRWRATDDIIDGWDWSLPPGVKPDPSSGVLINKRKVGPDFPGRLSRQVNWSWRELEPEEGRFDVEPLRKAVLKQIGHHPAHQYDYTARRTDRGNGQTAIGFALDGVFLAGGPHRVAVKITYRDRGNARWALVYRTPQGEQRRIEALEGDAVISFVRVIKRDAGAEPR